ncbi:hypothetical protein BUALT_Bualt03G0207000 [Buddleja alternifolia]|uniref:C3H1-type domain-containing protein n=1 Tax=Buddleja alternifolia TaxID=168488 RepID=A0AAV6Y6S4_9LAMI|nr:hypothetical protein BUALT_Bualt03G0207000 [Buddleja alternifolia]
MALWCKMSNHRVSAVGQQLSHSLNSEFQKEREKMVEGKLYKTRLCMLYQRGRCSRQSCHFAHGDADLRRSFNGRQEHHGGRDLRDRLDRMRSPLRKSSPGREDGKARHSSHGDSPRSPGRRIDRNHRKRKQLDGHSDYSGSFRMSDGAEDQMKDRRQTSHDTKMLMDEQVRELHSVIEMLDNDKRQLELYLEDKVQEAKTLTLKIQELEMQLSKEKEESKRFTTRIKKFIKAHNRQLWLQDELKRSHVQLQELGEQLDLVASGPGNVDNLNINIASDDEAGDYVLSPLHESQMNSSPHKKRPRVVQEARAALNKVNGERTDIGKTRLEKLSRQSENHDQLNSSKKPEAAGDVYNRHGRSEYEDKSRRGKRLPADIVLTDKYKVSETSHTLPSTGIAAHVMDEDVEVVEMNDRFQVVGNGSTRTETGVTSKVPCLPFPPPPPPPVSQNAYFQYKGEDENVDIDAVDEETVEVDIV